MSKLPLIALSLLVSLAVAPAQGAGVIKLTFLGTGAPRPSAERYGASTLVEAGGRKILVDAGPGARERIFQAGGFGLLTGITDIFLTHLHYDHVADVVDVWITGWMYGRTAPLHLHGPIGTKNFVDHIKEAYDWDIEYRTIVGIPAAGSLINVTEVRPGLIFEEDGIKITAFEVAHMPIDSRTGKPGELEGQTLGFRVDYQGRSVAFSGDLRALPASDLIKYGRGADVVVCEVQIPAPGQSAEAARANVSLSVHTSPEQAGYVFAQTQPRMAVYSHIIPPQTTAEELSAATRPYYTGPLTTAFDLMTLTIGDQIELGKSSPRDAQVFEQSRAVK
jgi:ribonuclease Z